MSGIMSLALLLAAAAVLCGLPPAAANVDAADASWLFSMGAEWAKVTGSPATNKWTAVLSGVPAYALAFTDRPNHVAKYVAVDRMLGTYANPPNAALAYIDAAGAHRQVTVMITSAAWASARKTSITLAFAVVPADRAGQPVPPQQAAGALTGLGCKAGAGGSMTCELRKPWLFIDNVSNPGTACAACTTNSQVRGAEAEPTGPALLSMRLGGAAGASHEKRTRPSTLPCAVQLRLLLHHDGAGQPGGRQGGSVSGGAVSNMLSRQQWHFLTCAFFAMCLAKVPLSPTVPPTPTLRSAPRRMAGPLPAKTLAASSPGAPARAGRVARVAAVPSPSHLHSLSPSTSLPRLPRRPRRSTYNCCDSGGNPNLLCGSSCGCSSNYYCSSGSCIPSCTPRPGRPCK